MKNDLDYIREGVETLEEHINKVVPTDEDFELLKGIAIGIVNTSDTGVLGELNSYQKGDYFIAMLLAAYSIGHIRAAAAAADSVV